MTSRAGGLALLGAALAAACGGAASSEGPVGSVTMDGSSTVFPITEAMAEEFGIETRGRVRITIAVSGTGGGFKRFCAGETDVNNASRHISAEERAQCEAAGIEWVEIPVAIDGLAVTVNPRNDFVECLTVAELRRIWEPGSTVRTWRDVRPEWPDGPLRLYGPGTASGTFDYFTEAVMGRAGATRPDFTASEDDNVLVQGVEGDRNALGYFGYAYYAENEGRLRRVAVDGGAGCVDPVPETIQDGRYSPLARPLFLYVTRAALARPEVVEFLRFYLTYAAELVPQVGYVPLRPSVYAEELAKLGARG
jgi:phosphate transport system substrate-binding protein